MISKTKIRLRAETIQALCSHAFPGCEVNAVTELTDGWFNASFAVSFLDHDLQDVVLKAGPPPDVPVMLYENDILRSEVTAMQYLADDPGIPIPEVLYSDFSRSVIESEFYIMSRLRGDPWNRVRDVLTVSENAQLERQFGDIHRRVNSRIGGAFGLLSPQQPRFSSWFAAFNDLFDKLLTDADRFEVVLPKDPSLIIRLLNEARPAFLSITAPRLIHWDLWEGNAFVYRNNAAPAFSGIIDFERSMWGDPLMEYWFTRDSPSEFVTGYGSNPLESPDARLRRSFYNLYLHTIMVVEDAPRAYDDKRPVERARGQFTQDMAAIREILSS